LFLSRTAEHARAFIKVQDGCNQFCSYCIIPYARGRVRSRKLKNVLAEVARLVDNGFKEIVLTGIHLSSYGVDLNDGENLLKLIQAVHKIEGLERIRLGSLEPKIITKEFAEEISKLPKMCPHFHLSLQSGCDATLKRMNRKYTTEEYKKGCDLLRKYFNHPAITTDVIVGFPGEDENEFSVTKEFLEDVHFYKMHIFKYSPRRGTRAESMPNQVDEQVKTRRSAELIDLDHRMSKEYRDFYLDSQRTALIEEKVTIEGKEYYTGYTMEYVKVAVESEADLVNQIVRGKIVKEIANDIYLLER
jgi:threonylcarbamoyladenosine tRNA methylthiotransferase MtaB